MTRTVKKLEDPRPLKSTTSSAHNRNSMLDVKINSGKYFVRIIDMSFNSSKNTI